MCGHILIRLCQACGQETGHNERTEPCLHWRCFGTCKGKGKGQSEEVAQGWYPDCAVNYNPYASPYKEIILEQMKRDVKLPPPKSPQDNRTRPGDAAGTMEYEQGRRTQRKQGKAKKEVNKRAAAETQRHNKQNANERAWLAERERFNRYVQQEMRKNEGLRRAAMDRVRAKAREQEEWEAEKKRKEHDDIRNLERRKEKVDRQIERDRQEKKRQKEERQREKESQREQDRQREKDRQDKKRRDRKHGKK